MKTVNQSFVLGAMLVLWNDFVFAQDATQTAATSAFNNNSDWMISIITGPICKVVACFFLFAGIWKLTEQKVLEALGCGIAFMILVLMPQILSMFPKAQ